MLMLDEHQSADSLAAAGGNTLTHLSLAQTRFVYQQSLDDLGGEQCRHAPTRSPDACALPVLIHCSLTPALPAVLMESTVCLCRRTCCCYPDRC